MTDEAGQADTPLSNGNHVSPKEEWLIEKTLGLSEKCSVTNPNTGLFFLPWRYGSMDFMVFFLHDLQERRTSSFAIGEIFWGIFQRRDCDDDDLCGYGARLAFRCLWTAVIKSSHCVLYIPLIFGNKFLQRAVFQKDLCTQINFVEILSIVSFMRVCVDNIKTLQFNTIQQFEQKENITI